MDKLRYLVVLDSSSAIRQEGPYVAEVSQGDTSYSTRYLAASGYSEPGNHQESPLSPAYEFDTVGEKEPAYVQECDVAEIVDLWAKGYDQGDLLDDISADPLETEAGQTSPSDGAHDSTLAVPDHSDMDIFQSGGSHYLTGSKSAWEQMERAAADMQEKTVEPAPGTDTVSVNREDLETLLTLAYMYRGDERVSHDTDTKERFDVISSIREAMGRV